MNRQELEYRTSVITALLAVWGCSADKVMISSYVTILKDIPADLLDAACKKLVIESENRPVPATIIKAARNLNGAMTNTNTLSFADAWREIEQQMNEVFVYGDPHFSRPEIKEAVEAFGWQELCSVLTRDLPIVRAQLRDIYNTICAQNIEAEINNHVVGKAPLLKNQEVKQLCKTD